MNIYILHYSIFHFFYKKNIMLFAIYDINIYYIRVYSFSKITCLTSSRFGSIAAARAACYALNEQYIYVK